MVYLVASLVSLFLLGGSLGLIFAMVSANHARIVGALLGQPVDHRTIVFGNARPRRRVMTSIRQPVMPLRAAA